MDRPGFTAALLHPRYWLLWLGLGLLWLVVQLPYRWLLGLGRVLGWGMFHLMSDRREVARTNLALCFPEMSEIARERLLRENFASNGIALFETATALNKIKGRIAVLTVHAVNRHRLAQERRANLQRGEVQRHQNHAFALGCCVVQMLQPFDVRQARQALPWPPPGHGHLEQGWKKLDALQQRPVAGPLPSAVMSVTSVSWPRWRRAAMSGCRAWTC
jgi:hypothetical protein